MIDRKVPTNQLEAVVAEVLKMVGVEARSLPSRGTAQNMRREMGHVADVVAGALLAKSENVSGASDDTTKRQRSLAADLVHFKLPDGSFRTLVIGLACMSSGTAAAKVQRFMEKLAQVQAAVRLSVPLHHGDEAIWDRITLLVPSWTWSRITGAQTEVPPPSATRQSSSKSARPRRRAHAKGLGSSLRCAQSAARVKAIVGHYLLHPLYLSTYHIEHVLELNDYMKWVLNLLDVLILDPTPLLEGDVHALQYFHRALSSTTT